MLTKTTKNLTKSDIRYTCLLREEHIHNTSRISEPQTLHQACYCWWKIFPGTTVGFLKGLLVTTLAQELWIPLDAKVSSTVRGFGLSLLLYFPLSIQWTASSSSLYKVPATSDVGCYKAHFPIVRWHHLVWFRKFIPRHCLILWIAIQESPIITWVFKLLVFFSLWRLEDESLSHLFFKCAYSRAIWKQVCLLCGMSKPQHSWYN